MRFRWHAAACVALVATVAPAPSPVSGAALRPGSVTGWVPYWETGTPTQPGPGIASIGRAHGAGVLTEVSPFVFSATTATTVKALDAAASVKMVVDDARARGLTVIPSITDGTGRLAMQAILADAATRTAHVNTLVNLVVNGFDFTGTTYDGITFDGIDLDYEGFAFADGRESWAKTQPLWLAFVQELATALHANGKLLSVTIPPIWDDGKSGYWVYGPWPTLTAAADRLRLMVYDWSVGSPGPIAPMSWVRNVIAYVQKTVPAAELGEVWLGVPQYGRSWARVLSGECPDQPRDANGTRVSLATTSVQSQNAPDLANRQAAAITEVEGEKTFSYPLGTFTGTKTTGTPPPPAYEPGTPVAAQVAVSDATTLAPAVRIAPTTTRTVTCTVDRVVHYPDNASVVMRAQAAQGAGFGGIVIWALGYEPADLWPQLAAA